jgi:uncharacterized protein with von Willebrand factor type A (vWA) domain
VGYDAHMANLAFEERDLDNAIRKSTCGVRTSHGQLDLGTIFSIFARWEPNVFAT